MLNSQSIERVTKAISVSGFCFVSTRLEMQRQVAKIGAGFLPDKLVSRVGYQIQNRDFACDVQKIDAQLDHDELQQDNSHGR